MALYAETLYQKDLKIFSSATFIVSSWQEITQALSLHLFPYQAKTNAKSIIFTYNWTILEHDLRLI